METLVKPVSPLRQRMLEDMRMRKHSPKTQQAYIRVVCKFTRYLGRSPDTATAEDLRLIQLHMVDQGTSPITLIHHFGLIANNGRKEKLALARQLLNVVPAANIEETVSDTSLDEPTRSNSVCAHYGAQMIVIESFVRGQEIPAPPAERESP
jgi:hypothetical protein